MSECYKYSAPLALGPKTLSPMTFYLHSSTQDYKVGLAPGTRFAKSTTTERAPAR
jgi:hypothetical protein